MIKHGYIVLFKGKMYMYKHIFFFQIFSIQSWLKSWMKLKTGRTNCMLIRKSLRASLTKPNSPQNDFKITFACFSKKD